MKNIDNFEIFIIVHDICNLKCDFCFEKKQKIDLIHIFQKNDINNIIITLKNQLKFYTMDNNIKLFKITICGGEIFQDIFNDIIFIYYKKLIQQLQIFFKETYIQSQLQIEFLSNGTFKNQHRVKQLLYDTNTYLSLSYDPVGRFLNAEQENQMLKNFNYFKKHNKITSVCCLLTKPIIEQYMHFSEKYIQILNSFSNTLDFTLYIPNKNWKKLLPTNTELINFFKWAYDSKIENVNLIKNIIYSLKTKKYKAYCNCENTIHITWNGLITRDCAKRLSTLQYNLFYNDIKNVSELTCNKILVNNSIKKLKCFQCEYYLFCPKPCWLLTSFKYLNDELCIFKELYKYINI